MAREEPQPTSEDVKGYLEQLGLSGYFPGKIKQTDVVCIKDSEESESVPLAWKMLSKLMLINPSGRYERRESSEQTTATHISTTANLLDELMEESAPTEYSSSDIHPQDVFIILYNCCNLLLRQSLMQKMFMCNLALPFLYPTFNEGKFELSLWGHSSIFLETPDGKEMAAYTHPVKVVSFVRLGSPALSKSKFLNHIMSDVDSAPDIFFNRDCQGAGVHRKFYEGIIECGWYLPSRSKTKSFEDITWFLNLRGNAVVHRKKVKYLYSLASVTVILVDVGELDNTDILEHLSQLSVMNPKRVVFVFTGRVPKGKDKKSILTKFVAAIKGLRCFDKVWEYKGEQKDNIKQLKVKLLVHLKNHLSEDQYNITMQDSCYGEEVANNKWIIDQSTQKCQVGISLAEEVLENLPDPSVPLWKSELLPLQGETWQKLSELIRSLYSDVTEGDSQTKSEKADKILEQMHTTREKQCKICDECSPFFRKFITILQSDIGTEVLSYVMQWLKIQLDNRCRKYLPEVREETVSAWQEYRKAKGTHTKSSDEIILAKQKALDAEKKLAITSFGVENLLREVSQFYEARKYLSDGDNDETKDANTLCDVVAGLMLEGHPIEFMDGDARNVPTRWLEGILDSLKRRLSNKKLTVLSILGVQSSGKSTLLNALFGLQLSVSAGRCTRGVYAQLIPVSPKSSSRLPFDYLLVLDTEGLRASEYAPNIHVNDNELATFVIGLADFNIINIMGETIAEVHDTLQIVVHAFLRMRIATKSLAMFRTCIFVHQCVSAVTARKMNAITRHKLSTQLNDMTKDAAKSENCHSIKEFKEVIRFDPEDSVLYFSNLWQGNPPMSPVNEGYSTDVDDLRDKLIKLIKHHEESDSFLSIEHTKIRINDLWSAIITDDFVFHFRNNLEIKAYKTLYVRYNELLQQMDKDIEGIVQKLHQKSFENLENDKDSLDACFTKMTSDFSKTFDEMHSALLKEFENFFEQGELRHIYKQWEGYHINLFNERAQTKKEKALFDMEKLVSVEVDRRFKPDHIKSLLQDDYIIRRAETDAEKFRKAEVSEKKVRELFETMLCESSVHGEIRTVHQDWGIEKRCDQVVNTLYHSKPVRRYFPDFQRMAENPPEMKDLRGSIGIEDITDSYNIRKKHLARKKTQNEVKRNVIDEVEQILLETTTAIDYTCSKIQLFNDTFAVGIFTCLEEKIDNFNKNANNLFEILAPLHSKMIVQIYLYAINRFKRMETGYNKKHGPPQSVYSREQVAWITYRNTFNRRTRTMVVADILNNSVIQPAVLNMRECISEEVVKRVRKRVTMKDELIRKILTDLAERENFQESMLYVQEPKTFAFRWLRSCVQKVLIDGQKPGDPLNHNIREKFKKLSKRILEGIQTAFTKAKQSGPSHHQLFAESLKEQLSDISLLLEENLYTLTEDYLNDIQSVKNEVKETLKKEEKNLLEKMGHASDDTSLWVGDHPHRILLDELWGCPEQCPLCGEPCIYDDLNHLKASGHRCIQHRPRGIVGIKQHQGDRLMTHNCNSYEAKMERKSRVDGWDIQPQKEVNSSYWMWFMNKYRKQLSSIYQGTRAPDVPNHWDRITKTRAIRSLQRFA